jgi:hypothetical protein
MVGEEIKKELGEDTTSQLTMDRGRQRRTEID